MCAHGVLSEESAERYDAGWLEDLEVDTVDRVFYLEAEVTVPAGGSVQLTAEMDLSQPEKKRRLHMKNVERVQANAAPEIMLSAEQQEETKKLLDIVAECQRQ